MRGQSVAGVLAQAVGMLGVKPGEIARVHLSNHAVRAVFGEFPSAATDRGVILHSMWEDRDLEGAEEAEHLADLLEGIAPGRFVLIDTGDYITPRPGTRGCSYERETYDALYRLVLVTMARFREVEGDLRRLDRQWREQRRRIADGLDEEPQCVKVGDRRAPAGDE